MKRRAAARPQRVPNLVSTLLDDELVLYDPRGERVHVLNKTAASIWHLCDGNHDRLEIAREMASRFNVGRSQALADVSELVKLFRNAGLIEYSGAAPNQP